MATETSLKDVASRVREMRELSGISIHEMSESTHMSVEDYMEMKLTEYVSDFMETPAIAESPVNIYCKVKEILRLGSHDMFLAEVVGVTVDEAYMDENGKFDLAACKLMAYSHGEYFALGKKLGKFGYSVKKKV